VSGRRVYPGNGLTLDLKPFGALAASLDLANSYAPY
jgi:hypothetical protein